MAGDGAYGAPFDAVKLRAEAEFTIFDQLPEGHRAHLRAGGRVNGYEEAIEVEFLRRYLAQQEGQQS